MRCVILQPSYIPWRGYFHQIYLADVFVFYDDVQYDKHGWRNRNRIKTHQGSQWLTIPVHGRGAPVDGRQIRAVEIDWSQPWNRKHWQSLQQSYRKAPYFERYAPLLEGFYRRRDELLADFTIDLTVRLAQELGIRHTRFLRSSELSAEAQAHGDRTERLIHILQQVGADEYLSGPSARDYIEDEKFAAAGIGLEYIRYNYPEYPQLHPPFDPQVSILDLLFMTGPEALSYIVPEENR
jgi:hypothetical protein